MLFTADSPELAIIAATEIAVNDPTTYPAVVESYAAQTIASEQAKPRLQELAERMRTITRRLIENSITPDTNPTFSGHVALLNAAALLKTPDDPLTHDEIDDRIGTARKWSAEKIGSEAQLIIAAVRSLFNPEAVGLIFRHKRTNHQSTARPSMANPRIRKTSTIDTVKVYLDEVGQHPLLEKAEEMLLATKAQAGRAAASTLESTPDLTEADTIRLKRLADEGSEAARYLYHANLRLVISIAKKYLPRRQHMELLDLVSAGNIGLLAAVEKFDPTRGNKFSTVATWWIRQAIQQEVANTDRTIRIPKNNIEIVAAVHRAVDGFEAEYGRSPHDDAELLAYAKLRKFRDTRKREPTESELAAFRFTALTPAKLVTYKNTSMHHTASLDAPFLGNFEEKTAYDAIKSEASYVDVESLAATTVDSAILNKLLKATPLTQLEIDILCLSFGNPAETPDGIQYSIGEITYTVPRSTVKPSTRSLSLEQLSNILNIDERSIARQRRIALEVIRDFASDKLVTGPAAVRIFTMKLCSTGRAPDKRYLIRELMRNEEHSQASRAGNDPTTRHRLSIYVAQQMRTEIALATNTDTPKLKFKDETDFLDRIDTVLKPGIYPLARLLSEYYGTEFDHAQMIQFVKYLHKHSTFTAKNNGDFEVGLKNKLKEVYDRDYCEQTEPAAIAEKADRIITAAQAEYRKVDYTEAQARIAKQFGLITNAVKNGILEYLEQAGRIKNARNVPILDRDYE